MSNQEPDSFLTREPLKRAQLQRLILALWLPLPIIALGVFAVFGFSIPLLLGILVGTGFSVGLAMWAGKVASPR